MGTTQIVFLAGIGLQYRFLHSDDANIYFEIDQSKIQLQKTQKKQDISLESHLNKQIATVKISGSYQAINQYYNQQIMTSLRHMRNVKINYLIKLIYKANTPEKALFVIDSLIQQDLQTFNKQQTLFDENSLVKEFIQNEIRAFYGAIFLMGIYTKYKQAKLENHHFELHWKNTLKDFIQKTKNTIEPIPHSKEYMEFLQCLSLALYVLEEDHSQKKSTDEMIKRYFSKPYTTLKLDDKSAYGWSMYGLQQYLISPYFYSPVLLEQINTLQKQYPKSKIIAFYQPLITKLESYVKKNHPFKKEVKFRGAKIINQKYNSFKDLLNNFKGKNICIDIWATWCKPCVEEFEKYQKIQAFIDSKTIEMLYISIDHPEQERAWKNTINFYKLKGSHYRANQAFIKDMWAIIEEYQGAIPRYILIDKQGNVFLNTASSPSKDLNLQIKTLISQSQN